MSTTIFGKAAIFFLSVEWWMYRCALRTSLGSRLLRQKMQRSLLERQTERKKSMSTTAQTYWPSSAEIWEGQRNYSMKNEVDKDAISCFSIRKDWRFEVRAKSFALHWRSRGFFSGSRAQLWERSIATPDATQAWFADDTGCGGSQQSAKMLGSPCEIGPQFGFIILYFPNATKTFLVVKPDKEDEAQSVFAGTGVALNASLKRYLGGALGQASFEEDFLREKVEDFVSHIKKLAVTVPQSDHSHTARCRKTPVGGNIVERKRSKEYRKGKELILLLWTN